MPHKNHKKKKQKSYKQTKIQNIFTNRVFYSRLYFLWAFVEIMSGDDPSPDYIQGYQPYVQLNAG